jgi:hypothetical protein
MLQNIAILNNNCSEVGLACNIKQPWNIIGYARSKFRNNNKNRHQCWKPSLYSSFPKSLHGCNSGSSKWSVTDKSLVHNHASHTVKIGYSKPLKKGSPARGMRLGVHRTWFLKTVCDSPKLARGWKTQTVCNSSTYAHSQVTLNCVHSMRMHTVK